MRRPIILLAFAVASLWAVASAQGAVHRWGAFGKQAQQRTPMAISGINKSEILKLDSGNGSAYVLESNGTEQAWGNNRDGQLGDGTNQPSFDAAVSVQFPKGLHVSAIGEERDSGMAVDSTGHGWAWGEGGAGSNCLGRGEEDVTVPREVPSLTGLIAVQGGAQHSIWLKSNGTVWSCGTNRAGELGTGETSTSRYAPVQAVGLSEVVEISAGEDVECARTASGQVYDWGNDEQGQVGNGQFERAVATPFHVPLPAAAVQISCGGNLGRDGSSLAVLAGGAIYAWGDDNKGQLGDGGTVNRPSPVLASQLTGLGIVQAVEMGECALGVTAAGNVYAWGSNEHRSLGTHERLGMSLTPLLVDTGAKEVSGTAYDSGDR